MGAILQYGLSVALVGMSTVFVGLIILIGLIKLMEMIMTGGKGKKKAEAPLRRCSCPCGGRSRRGDGRRRADCRHRRCPLQPRWNRPGEENTTGFVVRSIRRINNAPAWNRAGREEQVYSRM